MSKGVSSASQVLSGVHWLLFTFTDQYGSTSHTHKYFMRICLIQVKKKDKDIYITSILKLPILIFLRNLQCVVIKVRKWILLLIAH